MSSLANLVVQLLALAIGMQSAVMGFSTKFFFLTHFRLVRIYRTYLTLMMKGEVSDQALIRELLKFVREDLAELENSPDFAKFGLVRRWREAVRLTFEPGRIEGRTNFVGVNPIYAYNAKGEEVLVADKDTFYQLYRN